MAEKKEIMRGDTVYDINGRDGEYVGSLLGMHIVCPFYECGDDSAHRGDPEIWKEVFPEAPVEHFNQQITDLQIQVAEMEQKLSDLKYQTQDAKKLEQERLEVLRRNKALKRIEDFIKGAFTHYLIHDWNGLRIIRKEDAKGDDGARYDKDTKLLILFGRSNGDLEWRINQYYDGSGTWHGCVPCISEEDAKQQASEFVQEWFQAWRNKVPHDKMPTLGRNYPPYLSTVVESCKRLGLPIPEDAAAALRKEQAEAAQANVEQYRKQLQDAEEKLRAVQTV